MVDFDEIRLRLARADLAGKAAWSDATGLARRVLNTRGAGVADTEALNMMHARLAEVHVALNDLADVEELLARAVSGSPSRRVRPYSEDQPCRTCGRSDALVKLSICARCSQLGEMKRTI